MAGDFSTQPIQNTSAVTPTPPIGKVEKGVPTVDFAEGTQPTSNSVYPSDKYSIFSNNSKSIMVNSSGWNKEFWLNQNGDGVYLLNTAGNFERNGIEKFQEEVKNTVKKMVQLKQDDIGYLAQIEYAKTVLPEDTEYFRMPGVGPVCTYQGVTMTVNEALAHHAA